MGTVAAMIALTWMGRTGLIWKVMVFSYQSSGAPSAGTSAGGTRTITSWWPGSAFKA